MLLSIIIPTYNRAPVLKRLLEDLARQTDPDFQVVVAMDGCTDDTPQMLETLDVPYDLKWRDTKCADYGLAVARNLGVLAAEGELIAIIDDDSFPVPGYVAACKRSAVRRTITGGPRTPSDPSETRQVWKMAELAKIPPCEPLDLNDLRMRFPTAVTTECNICMFREDIIEMGLFSERLKLYGFIGQEFFARARYLGIRYQYDPTMETIHDRQEEDASGLSTKRKQREIMIATALRQSFMTPVQFGVQQNWARSMAADSSHSTPLPSTPKSAFVLFPYRFARNRAGNLRRRIRKAGRAKTS